MLELPIFYQSSCWHYYFTKFLMRRIHGLSGIFQTCGKSGGLVHSQICLNFMNLRYSRAILREKNSPIVLFCKFYYILACIQNPILRIYSFRTHAHQLDLEVLVCFILEAALPRRNIMFS